MAGQLGSTAAFFNKTWENRFKLSEAPVEAQTALGKIIEGTKEGRTKKLEQTVRAKLLDQMAELTAQRASSTDKAFNQNIAPVLRGLGKLIAQKDQAKFFKQLKDFDDSLFALHSKDAATAKKIREDVGLTKEAGVLNDIAEAEKDSIHDYKLTGDLKTTLANLLGPLGPVVHIARQVKSEYGPGFGKVWGKLKDIVAQREAARAAMDDEADQRQGRFTKFMQVVKTGIAKVKIKDFFSKIIPSKSAIINLGKGLLSKKALGAALGAASLIHVYQKHKHPSDAAKADSVPEPTATATQLGPLPAESSADEMDENGAPTQKQAPGNDQQSKGMIADAQQAISDCMSDFGDWFKHKWSDFEDFFKNNPLFKAGEAGLKGLKEGSDYLMNKTTRLFKAVPDMLRSVFRTIYNMLPTPIQKGVDWALKAGGESLRFFAKLLGDETSMEIDAAQAGVPSSQAGASQASVTQPGPTAAAPVAAGDAVAAGSGSFPGLKITQNADVADLKPQAKSPLLAMAQEYLSTTGKTLQINTAFRSSKEQVALYTDGKHNAAKPGTSMHEYGFAIDMHAADANKLDQMGLLAKYGFVRPVRGEPWHLEPASIQAMKASIRQATPGGGNQQVGVGTSSQAYAAQPVAATGGGGGGHQIGGAPDISSIQAKHEPAKAPGMATAQQTSGLDTMPGGGAKSPTQTAVATISMDDSKYDRAPSNSRRVSKTVQADKEEPPAKSGTGSHKSSMDGISFYIGDFPFLALNMGMTEA